MNGKYLSVQAIRKQYYLHLTVTRLFFADLIAEGLYSLIPDGTGYRQLSTSLTPQVEICTQHGLTFATNDGLRGS